MTDEQVFRTFMQWMMMRQSKEIQLENGNILLMFTDSGNETKMFSKCGYDDFHAGIIVDRSGNLIEAFLDSHVAQRSTNCKLLTELAET
jgi:hypothetical protein